MNKICILGVYFGKLPDSMPLWLKSCRFNSTIDFMLFTDQDVKKIYSIPNNIKIIPMTLEGIKERASEKIGFEVLLDRPYKCCDYKVIYGLIFEDILKKYDYWGYCDFDLIFGDLQYFFDKYRLYEYDKFLGLGHLSLYRNKLDVNERYKCTGAQKNYDVVYNSNRSFYFDELGGIGAIYLKNNFSFFRKRIFADISILSKRFRLSEEYNLDGKVKNYRQQIFYYENGKVYREYIYKFKRYKEEYIYIHFKKRKNLNINFEIENTDSFYITDKGFFEKKSVVTDKDIYRLNSSEDIKDIYYLFKNRVIKKLVKIKKGGLTEKV